MNNKDFQSPDPCQAEPKPYWIVLHEIGEAPHSTFLGKEITPEHTEGWHKCKEVYGERYHDDL